MPSAGNFTSQSSQYLPSTGVAPQPAASTQGIRYRGQAPLSSAAIGQGSQDRSDHIQSELDAMLERWRATASTSLDQTSTLREELRRRGVLTEEVDRILQASSSHQNPLGVDSRSNLARYDSPPWGHNTTSAQETNSHTANARFPAMPAWNPSPSLATTNSGNPIALSQASSMATASEHHDWAMPGASSLEQSNTNASPATASNNPSAHGVHADPIGTSTFAQSDTSSTPFLEQIQDWQSLSQQVMEMENLVNQHIIPSVDMMFRIRTQLQSMLAERQGQNIESIHSIPPNHRLFPSTAGAVEVMMNRVTRLYERVDQITLIQQAQRIRLGVNSPSYSQIEPSRIYLATHPDGRQSLILPPDTTIRTSHEVSSFQSHAAPAPEAQVHPNAANPAAVQQAVRQILINQQQRRAPNPNDEGLGRYVRRVWMFVRMYFFCYMISDSGTWTRIVLVTCAVLVAVLSDTDIPQQLHGAIVAPVQRHLEGLAHMGGPADQSTQRPDQGGDNRGNPAPQGMFGEVFHFLRRAERSIVLLLASLVPGIGERQVEARNAAEAERVRQEQEQEQEQEREREREREREQEQAQELGGEIENEHGREQAESDAAAPVATMQPEQAVA